MSTEILPIDVIDHILSFLRSDIDTLKTCAKSHPILSTPSERYIYADVTLRDDIYDIFTPTDLRTSEFTQILAKKSDIANHVRTLEVVCVSGDPGTEQHEMTCSHLDGVASLLPMLAGLTRFKIRGSYNNDPSIAWHAMPETFCQAFLRYLHAHVTKDTIIGLIRLFPMSLLDGCRNARVSLEHCEEMQFEGNSTSNQVLRQYPAPFEHISIENCSETGLENVAAWVKLHGLRSLFYSPFYEFSNSFQLLLAACSNSLTSLHLNASPAGDNDTSYQISNNFAIHTLNENIVHFPFTLANLPHLTHLTIDTNPHLGYSGESWTLYSSIPAIQGLISTASPTLKNLSIKAMFTFIELGSEHLLDPAIIWFPFIPLAASCSSASVAMYISPTFVRDSRKEFAPGLPSPLADYKGLEPYVQSGVVVISER